MDGVHEALDSWMGPPRRQQKEGNVTLTYRVTSKIAADLADDLRTAIR
jgi:hypothetical protein